MFDERLINRVSYYFGISIIAFWLGACASGFHRTISTSSVGPSDQEEVLGVVTGHADYYLIPILSPFCYLINHTPCGIGDNTYEAALQDATSQVDAHTLVNVYEDDLCLHYPVIDLFVLPCQTRITGTAIRYKNPRAKFNDWSSRKTFEETFEAAKHESMQTSTSTVAGSDSDYIEMFKICRSGTRLKIITKSKKIILGKFKSYDANSKIVWMSNEGAIFGSAAVYISDIQSVELL